MADPLSVAGLAAGLVSLGIQLCGGVVTYLDGLSAREHELQAARQQVKEVANLLDIIQAHTDCLENSHARASRAARSCAETCQAQINELEDLVAKLTGSGAGGTGLRQRVHDKGKRLMYPFHRPDLEALEARLDRLNGSLQVALQVLDLGMTSSIEKKVTEMHALLSRLDGSQMQISVVQRPLTTAVAPYGSQPGFSPTDTLQNTAATILSHPEAQNLNIGPSRCYCLAKQSWSLSVKRWGYWNVYHESTSSKPHLPGCRFGKGTTPKQRNEVGLEYTGLVGMINAAFRLSFLTVSDTGRYSISPCLTYYPAVDEETAPVFKMLDMAWEAVIDSRMPRRGRILSVQDGVDLVELCVAEIVALYKSNRALPRVADSSGRTAMHALVRLLNGLRNAHLLAKYPMDALDALCLSTVGDFIDCHVPTMQHDNDGESPAATIIQAWLTPYYYQKSTIRQQLVSTLVSADQKSLPVLLDYGIDRDSYIDEDNLYCSNELFRNAPEIAEACECGPLSVAIYNGDIAAAAKLLTRDPSCLHERNTFGQTPMHFAAKHSQILELLTCHKPSFPLDPRDTAGKAPLHYACFFEHFDCVQILVDSGCPIDPKLWLECYDDAMTELLLRGIGERRDQLKVLGLQNLPTVEAKRLGLLDGKRLDHYARAVQEQLERLEIDIPVGLKIETHYGMYSQRTWHYLNSKRESLWAHGFRDVDALNSRGHPPILMRGYMDSQEINFDDVSWFLQHGANLSTHVHVTRGDQGGNDCTSLTTAHFLSAQIGKLWSRRDSDPNERILEIIRSVTDGCSILRQDDECFCLCSMGGCTPLKFLCTWLCLRQDDAWRGIELRPPNEISEATSSFLTKVQPEFSDVDYQQALRITTFQTMGIRHTCCRIDPSRIDRDSGVSREDVDEFNSEQDELIGKFEDLLDQLSDIFYEQKDGKPLGIADPDEFWNRRWLPLVEKAHEDLSTRVLTKSEIEGAEEVGVHWDDNDSGDDEVPTLDDLRKMITEIAEGAR